MKDREKLHYELLKYCKNAYFQPPENLRISYPCIVYARSTDDLMHADNIAYKLTKRYDLTIIDKNPESEIADNIIKNLRYCEVTNRYVADNLYHTKIKLYF